ncbi:hypothetical protein EDF62_3317 [Leucobacter luti]|uniref:Uncharacterized protein n=2 Tax=Leucobacter luti TaxID=340320 RepID=A0A4R6RS65_9MICO|nr:hypothetical protein EDF62_3317 [Leucobacter luti]
MRAFAPQVISIMNNQTRRQNLGLGRTAAGGSGGSFASHERDSAAPPAAPHRVPEHTSASVQTPEYSRQMIADRWGDDITDLGRNGGGLHGFEIQRYMYDGTPDERRLQVTFDSQGDVRQVLEHFPKAGVSGIWREAEDYGEELQASVRRSRLRDMGVAAEGAENDGGSYGNRFTGARRGELDGGHVDAAQVAKLIRADVKRAQEWGALPPGKVFVTTAKSRGSQSIQVTAEVPEGTAYRRAPKGMSEEDLVYWQRTDRGRPSITASNITQTLSAIGDQWNDHESDSMRGYSTSDYHLSANVREQAPDAGPGGDRTLVAAALKRDEDEDRRMADALRRGHASGEF